MVRVPMKEHIIACCHYYDSWIGRVVNGIVLLWHLGTLEGYDDSLDVFPHCSLIAGEVVSKGPPDESEGSSKQSVDGERDPICCRKSIPFFRMHLDDIKGMIIHSSRDDGYAVGSPICFSVRSRE